MNEPFSFREYLKNLGKKILYVLTSRKFWAATGASIVLASSEGGITQAITLEIVAIWVAYIFATAWEDVARSTR